VLTTPFRAGPDPVRAPPDRLMTDPAVDTDILFRPLLGRRGILLAVSGGPDSTALMILTARWRRGEGRDVPVCVATVDHGLRSEAASETELVCANAAELGLQSISLKAQLRSAPSGEGTVGEGGNVQARAREARYRCLVEAARAREFDTIATAHHQEDQAETFLIRLARGSGVYGLGGMVPETALDGLTLARPLLGVDRAFLHAVAAESGLACVADPSNEDPTYARVR
jgi:tRNA(Ile)-lysidine synthase